MDKGAWEATVHGITKSDMTEQLSTVHSLSDGMTTYFVCDRKDFKE